MAPEIALKQDYTKSVDIWSIGIIMYYVLTGGKHPLYITNTDNVETYKKKLQDLDEFELPVEFSWLAKSLF
jgi:calcium/calmodulin-dependent protein kinase I